MHRLGSTIPSQMAFLERKSRSGVPRTPPSPLPLLFSLFPCFTVNVIWWWWWCVRVPRSGELRTQKLKSHLVRTQSLNVLPLKLGVGQYIAINATLTARNIFLAYFYPSRPFTCIFLKPLPISPVLVVANARFLCRPAE